MKKILDKDAKSYSPIFVFENQLTQNTDQKNEPKFTVDKLK